MSPDIQMPQPWHLIIDEGYLGLKANSDAILPFLVISQELFRSRPLLLSGWQISRHWATESKCSVGMTGGVPDMKNVLAWEFLHTQLISPAVHKADCRERSKSVFLKVITISEPAGNFLNHSKFSGLLKWRNDVSLQSRQRSNRLKISSEKWANRAFLLLKSTIVELYQIVYNCAILVSKPDA